MYVYCIIRLELWFSLKWLSLNYGHVGCDISHASCYRRTLRAMGNYVANVWIFSDYIIIILL